VRIVGIEGKVQSLERRAWYIIEFEEVEGAAFFYGCRADFGLYDKRTFDFDQAKAAVVEATGL
jgi:hypothetical protein